MFFWLLYCVTADPDVVKKVRSSSSAQHYTNTLQYTMLHYTNTTNTLLYTLLHYTNSTNTLLHYTNSMIHNATLH